MTETPAARSRLVSTEGESAYQRWEAPVVDGVAAVTRPMTANQLEQIQRHAREEGFAQGLRDAQAQAHAQAQRLERLIGQLAEPFAELDQAVDEELAALAVAIARQLVRRELRQDPAGVIGVVREAVAMLPSATRSVRIHLHPEDAALVRSLLTLPEGERGWQIVEDTVLARGDCRVLSETSQIDARLDARLTNILAGLLGGERKDDREPG